MFDKLATIIISGTSGALFVEKEYLLAITALGAIYVIYMIGKEGEEHE